jgi:hypothetical protein
MSSLGPCVPNCSFDMYEGDGGVTFLVALGRSLELLRANMAAPWGEFAGFVASGLDGMQWSGDGVGR